MKYVQPNGEEESVFADGTVQRLLTDGNRVIVYANGQKETHTKEYKVDYPYTSPIYYSSFLLLFREESTQMEPSRLCIPMADKRLGMPQAD